MKVSVTVQNSPTCILFSELPIGSVFQMSEGGTYLRKSTNSHAIAFDTLMFITPDKNQGVVQVEGTPVGQPVTGLVTVAYEDLEDGDYFVYDNRTYRKCGPHSGAYSVCIEDLSLVLVAKRENVSPVVVENVHITIK